VKLRRQTGRRGKEIGVAGRYDKSEVIPFGKVRSPCLRAMLI